MIAVLLTALILPPVMMAAIVFWFLRTTRDQQRDFMASTTMTLGHQSEQARRLYEHLEASRAQSDDERREFYTRIEEMREQATTEREATVANLEQAWNHQMETERVIQQTDEEWLEDPDSHLEVDEDLAWSRPSREP